MAHSQLFKKFKRTLQKAHQLNNLTSKKSPAVNQTIISKTKRRHFLRLAALAGGSAITATSFPRFTSAQSSANPQIAIVGGGIAGLNAAYNLKKAGLTATIYEGRKRVGGRIHSVTNKLGKDLVLELGGSFINTNHQDMLRLVKEFNLQLFDRVKDANNSGFPVAAYYFDGESYSEAEVAENLRPLAAQIATDASLIEKDSDRYTPKIESLSVTQYLDQHQDKIPESYIRTLIENTIRTEYGVEPQESSALQLIYNLPTVEKEEVEILASDETYMVQGGNGKIIDSLAEELSGQIQTNKRLLAISKSNNSYQLTFQDNSIVNADYVIIAIPFTTLRQVDIKVQLPPTLTKFIQEANLGRNDKVFAGFNNRIWRQKEGFAGDAWTDLGFSEVWDATGRQQERGDGALTFFFGGEEVAEMRSQPLQPFGEDLLDRFEELIPDAKSAATNKFFRTGWSNDPFTKGAYTSWKPGQYLEFSEFFWIESADPQERQEVNIDNLVFAGEHVSDEFYGYMNGGAQTGRLAAEFIARKMNQ
ncbi:MAG: FAD-dependent oxidoreductase [Waterburya sp.]